MINEELMHNKNKRCMHTVECISHKPTTQKVKSLTYWLLCFKGVCVRQKWASLTVFLPLGTVRPVY